MKKFLTAEWQDLVMANYVVAPEILAEFLPPGVALDLWENECYISLVAFKFLETAMMGVKIPFHTDFEEVNLRFYVRREIAGEIRRGVVFFKEIVPRTAISLVANLVYGEPYETWKMSRTQNGSELSYFWSKDDCENRVTVEQEKSLGVPAADSHGAFIIEHYWGYTKRGAKRTDEYKVEHPKWELFAVNYAEIDVDFGETYGAKFDFLSAQEPKSILLAKGSPITVYKGEKMAGM